MHGKFEPEIRHPPAFRQAKPTVLYRPLNRTLDTQSILPKTMIGHYACTLSHLFAALSTRFFMRESRGAFNALFAATTWSRQLYPDLAKGDNMDPGQKLFFLEHLFDQ